MSDSESEHSDVTDPGSFLGNSSSFDSGSDPFSGESDVNQMDISSSDEELVVGNPPARAAQRATLPPRVARVRQRGGRAMRPGVRVRGGRGGGRRGGLRTSSTLYRQGWRDGKNFVPNVRQFTGNPGNAADYSQLSIL